MSYWPCLTQEEKSHLSTTLAPWQPISPHPSPLSSHPTPPGDRDTPPPPACLTPAWGGWNIHGAPIDWMGNIGSLCVCGGAAHLTGPGLRQRRRWGDRRPQRDSSLTRNMDWGEGVQETGRQRWWSEVAQLWNGSQVKASNSGGGILMLDAGARIGDVCFRVCAYVPDTCLPMWRLYCLCAVTSLSVTQPPERRWAAMPTVVHPSQEDRTHTHTQTLTYSIFLGYKAKRALMPSFTFPLRCNVSLVSIDTFSFPALLLSLFASIADHNCHERIWEK